MGDLRCGRGPPQPPRDPMPCLVPVLVPVERSARRPGAREAVGVRCDAPLHELRQLLAPRHLDEAGHAALLPNRLRYASMRGSRSPSITRCTSVVFNSVRGSFTIVDGWNT